MSSEPPRDGRLQRLYDREGRNTSSMDPKMMDARVFIGNLAADRVTRQDVVKLFEAYGKVLGVSLHKSYGFVQFDKEENAQTAVKAIDGVMLEGLKVDVNIATERRKDIPPERPRGGFAGRGGGRRPRSPSPPFRPRDRFEMERPVRWERERVGWRGSPPPMGGGPPFRDRERDPYFERFSPHPHMRDPYTRPRDDPYERYPRDRERFQPPPRDFFGPQRDHFPPPRDRFHPDHPLRRGSPPPLPDFDRGLERDRRLSMEERERDRRPVLAPMKREADGSKRQVEMEIIVINRQQREYATLVNARVQEIGLTAETQHLSPTVSLADALDSAAQQGLLYAIIITSQHEMHRSVTLTILHGRNPQEHKNMPLDDALGLISKDFDRYQQSGRAHAGARKSALSNDVPDLLGKAASGASLSSDELSAVISALRKQKAQDDGGGSAASHHGMQPSDKAEPNTAEDIQRQQADLQAKILSLLGSSAVVPSSSSPTSKPLSSSHGASGGGSYDHAPNRGAVSYPQQSSQNSSSGYSSYGGSAGGSGGSGYSAYAGYNYR